MKRIFYLLTLQILVFMASAQSDSFRIGLEPLDYEEMGGLQSFAYGQYDGNWIIFGGRLDGLHRRQPFAAFDVAGNNNQIIVFNPQTLQKYTVSISSFPPELKEPLSSTNMQFYQNGNYLYLVGGYGYHQATASRKTFDYLTAIDLKALYDSVIQSKSILSAFRQVQDSMFAVTGGHLKRINQTYYLIGGNRFDGNYNPMGNPTFTQVYTDAIRKFIITDDGLNLAFQSVGHIVDPDELHRRDYNAVPQIWPDESEGVMVFSGVFQRQADLPFLNTVSIDSTRHWVNANFEQYYNHYHCPVMPLFDAKAKQMHQIFFGGIAQFYDSAGTRIKDDRVPFVNTITKISREQNGQMNEQVLPIQMPGFLGAGAEFILMDDLPTYNNEVIRLNNLSEDSTLVGYIYGGINSTGRNIFFSNTGTQSTAHHRIYKVYIIKESGPNTKANQDLESAGNMLHLQLLPNPNKGRFIIHFESPNAEGLATITISDQHFKQLDRIEVKDLKQGANDVAYDLNPSWKNQTIYVTLQIGKIKVTEKMVALDH